MTKAFKIICCLSVMIVLGGCQNVTQNHKDGDSVTMNEEHETEVPEAEVPEADVDTQNQINQKITSEKPFRINNSEVRMKTKINKKHMLHVKIQNIGKEKISFSSQYQLYKRHGENWDEVACLPNVGFKDIAYYLEKNETYSDKVDIEKVFGKLELGQYKIEKEFSLQESRILVSSEFEIYD